ncbi:MAG TPA: PEGA domain-containing protein [Candidatus Woesebacteria bacterium]|nr:PEGA domain-containing protein [Candidatus Woesebacteria bacterium]HNS65081.1 PEGA domain-containing protein [Candidatus Woesebacteria bacterium]
MHVPRNKGLLFTVFSALVIVVGTYMAIRYAKGGFRVTDSGISQETGLLSVSSLPTGAEVYINEKLVTATSDTLYLDPDQYEVAIRKDGYTEWKKIITLEKEVVSQANALLFPSAPSLTPLTFTGIENLSPSPDGQKILFYSASNSAQKKNGLYVLELSDNSLSLQRGARQISQDSSTIDLATAKFIWSPDSTQIIVFGSNREVLLDVSRLNDLDALSDISFRRKQLLSDWEDEMALREQQFLGKFPPAIIKIATSSATNVFFSPDKKRLLYTATESATLDPNLIPALPGANSQPEERQLQAGGIYIYDREEDKNFRVGTQQDKTVFPAKSLLSTLFEQNQATPNTIATTSARRSLEASSSSELADLYRNYHSSLFADTYQWFPDSKHIFSAEDSRIVIKEYDNTNAVTVYSGPFFQNFIYPWPDGSRLLIATHFNPETPNNLYAIELR